MTEPENTAGMQRGKPFQKGQSGNPDGRPKGSRNATTLALETLLDGQATALTQKAIDLALAGDMARVGSYVLRSVYRGRCTLQQGCAPAP
jgi:hypothetical protein